MIADGILDFLASDEGSAVESDGVPLVMRKDLNPKLEERWGNPFQFFLDEQDFYKIWGGPGADCSSSGEVDDKATGHLSDSLDQAEEVTDDGVALAGSAVGGLLFKSMVGTRLEEPAGREEDVLGGGLEYLQGGQDI